jgi:hypothetical protein
MKSIEIEKIVIPIQQELLLRWKNRDPLIVPEYVLNTEGNGVANSYGFGEWVAENYFRRKGYYVINDEFDLYSKTSKYKVYNDIITNIVGKEKMLEFQRVIRQLYKTGYKSENVDLFVFNTNSFFFVEVKKGKDVLREPQVRFMYLAKEILNAECKLVFLSETESETKKEIVKVPVTSRDLSIEGV